MYMMQFFIAELDRSPHYICRRVKLQEPTPSSASICGATDYYPFAPLAKKSAGHSTAHPSAMAVRFTSQCDKAISRRMHMWVASTPRLAVRLGGLPLDRRTRRAAVLVTRSLTIC